MTRAGSAQIGAHDPTVVVASGTGRRSIAAAHVEAARAKVTRQRAHLGAAATSEKQERQREHLAAAEAALATALAEQKGLV